MLKVKCIGLFNADVNMLLKEYSKTIKFCIELTIFECQEFKYTVYKGYYDC